MKKLIILLSLFFLIITPVFGKEATGAGTTRNAEFRVKIQQIKDKNKQKIAERINQQLAHINKISSEALAGKLETMQTLLNKIVIWKDKAKTGGKDTSAAETAITQAQTAITNAQTAVEEQKLKEYVIEFSEESGLRVGASQAKTSLRTDLEAVREKVKAARQAVVDSLKAVKQLYPKVSPQPSPSTTSGKE